jgi:hypothetical protein
MALAGRQRQMKTRSRRGGYSPVLRRLFNRVPLWRGAPQKAMKTGCGEEMANLSLVSSRFFKGVPHGPAGNQRR